MSSTVVPLLVVVLVSSSLMNTSSLVRAADGIPPEVADVLAKVRAALGPWPGAGVELVGSGTIRGAPSQVKLLFAKDGRFAREVDGALAESIRFDGAHGFEMGESGIAVELVRSGLEIALLEHAVISGSFADSPERFVWGLVAQPDPADSIVLEIASVGSRTSGRLVLDASTHLPRALTIPSFAGDYRMQLADYSEIGGRQFPRRIDVVTAMQSPMDWNVTEGSVVANPPVERFVPQRKPRGFHFERRAKSEIAVKKLPTGHFLVHGTIDGEDRGAIAFDTGAAVSVVHERVAKAAAMELIGSSSLVGAGGEVMQTEIRRGKSFGLGTLSIDDPAWIVAAEDSPIGKVFTSIAELAGEDVAAIVGFDVLIRSIVELDLGTPSLTIHDPSQFDARGLAWEPLILHRRHPFVKAKFNGDHEGLFCIDSGAGSISVIFHGPVVKELNLLQGRKTQPVYAQGAGGRIELRFGTIDDFEVGGVRTENPQCLFSQDEDGALADVDSEGTMGHAFFQSVVMFLDYGNGRIAFRPRAAK